MKNRTLLLLLLGFAFATNQLYSQQFEEAGRIVSQFEVAPGQGLGNGMWSVGKLTKRSYTDADYLHNVLLVKITEDVSVGKEIQLPSRVASYLNRWGSYRLRQPFPSPAEPVLLSSESKRIDRIVEVRFATEIDVVEICRELEEIVGVEYAEPHFIQRAIGTPNDSLFSDQYALDLVDAVNAWDITTGDSSVTIAIVDAGVDLTHEDLADNIWTNWEEIPDNGIDEDDNGFVDDVHGWDFVGNTSILLATAGFFSPDNDPNPPAGLGPRDPKQHGVHCAGVAAGVTDNGIGIAGLGSRCRIIPVKIGSDQINSNLYNAYEGLFYAGLMGADVISCSWGGGPFSQANQDVVSEVTSMGSVIIAAAGNDRVNVDVFPHYPSSLDDVFSVGATDASDVTAGFSNRGVGADVYAPGVNILSTVSGETPYSADWSGTSMATPLVSGLAGLLKTVHPDWTPHQIMLQMRGTVDDVIERGSDDRPIYFGRINANRALSGDIPGIDVLAVATDQPGGIVRSNGTVELSLTLHNYLATGNNVRVSLTPANGSIIIENPFVDIDSLVTGEEAVANFRGEVALEDRWFEGTIDMIVKIEADDYLNYDIVQLPFTIPSENTFTLIVEGLPAETEAIAGHSPSSDVLWGVGNVPGAGGGFVRYVNGEYNVNIIATVPITSVVSFDEFEAYAVATSALFHTLDGGTTWGSSSVSSITPNVGLVNFVSRATGTFIGDEQQNSFGIGKTIDSGQTWQPLETPVAAETGETVGTNAVVWLGENAWFGTSLGRIYRSVDGGDNWTESEVVAGKRIEFLSFSSSTNGVAMFRDTQNIDEVKFASTTDGGAAWTILDVTTTDFNVTPVHLASTTNSQQYVILGKDGSVFMSDDNGVSWRGVRSRKTNAIITAGTTTWNDERIRVWSLGTSVGYLDIPIGTTSVEGENVLGPLDLSQVDFDKR